MGWIQRIEKKLEIDSTSIQSVDGVFCNVCGDYFYPSECIELDDGTTVCWSCLFDLIKEILRESRGETLSQILKEKIAEKTRK